jgi:hypothetical protein
MKILLSILLIKINLFIIITSLINNEFNKVYFYVLSLLFLLVLFNKQVKIIKSKLIYFYKKYIKNKLSIKVLKNKLLVIHFLNKYFIIVLFKKYRLKKDKFLYNCY